MKVGGKMKTVQAYGLSSLILFFVVVVMPFQNCSNIPHVNMNSSNSTAGSLPLTPTATVTDPVITKSEFYQKIKPIFENSCVKCHSSGQVASRISFESSNFIASYAQSIKSAITERRMPPFDVSSDDGTQIGVCNSPEFSEDRRLSQADINTINSWIDRKVNSNSLLTEANEKNIKLNAYGVENLTTSTPGVVAVRMKNSFSVPAVASTGKVDRYRCFVLDAPTATDKFLVSYQVIPGNPGLVHHSILYQPNAGEDIKAANLDSGTGYDCDGGADQVSNGQVILPISSKPLVIWAPGVAKQDLPPQTGIRVHAGRKLILQMHYNIAATPDGASDQSQVLLKLADSVNKEADYLLVGASDPNGIPPGNPAYVVQSQATPIPAGYESVYGVLPHMHSSGRKIKLENTSNGQCYSFIPNWRFSWQLAYFYKQPQPIQANQNLSVTCTYDSTHRTTVTKFSEGSSDEMCLGFVYAVKPSTQSGVDFSVTPIPSGTFNSSNMSAKIIFKGEDTPKSKQLFVAVAIPTSAALTAYDYYFLNSAHQWQSVGQDISTAIWPSIDNNFRVGSASDTIQVYSAIDMNTIASGTIVYVGYGVGETTAAAQHDLQNRSNYSKVFLKP